MLLHTQATDSVDSAFQAPEFNN
eukprot:COSAG02_NODE_47504_length_340_cov_1.464730_1_plen_22_part_10